MNFRIEIIREGEYDLTMEVIRVEIDEAGISAEERRRIGDQVIDALVPQGGEA